MANTQMMLAVSGVAVRTVWLHQSLYNCRLMLDSEGREQPVPFCCTAGAQHGAWNKVGGEGVREHSVDQMEIMAPHIHQVLYSL